MHRKLWATHFFKSLTEVPETTFVKMHIKESAYDTAQMGKMRHAISRMRHEHVYRDHEPHRVLDSHREKEEHQKHPVREELVVRHENSHQGSRSPDNRAIRHTEPEHGQAEHRRKNSAEKIHSRKMLCPHHIGHFATEHPEHQHIEEEMPEIYMHEHVSYKAPSLLRGKRPEGTKVGNVFGNATITEAGQIQVQPENVAANERKAENDCIRNQQDSQNFR